MPDLRLRDKRERHGGLTLRSLLLGLVIAVVISIAEPYSQLILKSSLLTCDYLPLGAVFLFFIVVAGINVLLKLMDHRVGLLPDWYDRRAILLRYS